MIYNKYGTTEIKISRLGFGGMRFDKIDDIDVCASLVKKAYDSGINYFDTAPGYFEGKSEERFGTAFLEMKKTRAEKPFYVSTKTTGDNPDTVRKNCEESLKRMNLDYLDFYHVWYLTSLDEYFNRKEKGVLKEFEKLKSEGLVKHIVFSCHLQGNEIEKVIADYDFEGMLLGYSAMNYKFRESAIALAASKKMSVVVMNPLGGGIIPENPKLFSFLQNQENETVVEGAIRFLLNDERITIVLVGFGNEQHLDEAIKAVDGFSPYSPEALKKVQDGLSGAMDRICTGCGYCLPDCPENIPIAKNMQSYNIYMLKNNDRAALMETMKWGHQILDNGKHKLDQCTECGNCEKACTQHLPIIERFNTMKKEMAAAGHYSL